MTARPGGSWQQRTDFHPNKAVKGTSRSQKASKEQALPIKATNQQSLNDGRGNCDRLEGRRQI